MCGGGGVEGEILVVQSITKIQLLKRGGLSESVGAVQPGPVECRTNTGTASKGN